ncbi:MAG: hypothetical protein ACP5VR_12765 [Acidimicrobiales bacterium]
MPTLLERRETANELARRPAGTSTESRRSNAKFVGSPMAISEKVLQKRCCITKLQRKEDPFALRIGTGKWLQDLTVAALGTLLVSELFLVVDVPETAWDFAWT